MDYAAPTRLPEALELLAREGVVPVAGATDFYPSRVGRPSSESILDLTGLTELRGIQESPDELRIGALVTWSEIAAARLPSGCLSLQQAARRVGGIQVQNTGTIAGNLCNASPAADGIPPLLTLDAEVELASASGTRRLPVDRFVVGYRTTDLRPGELLTAVIIPTVSTVGTSAFLKLGSRTHLVISIAMVAVRIMLGEGDSISTARVAVGACSPTAQRLTALEAALEGAPSRDAADLVEPGHLVGLAPIDDPRAPARYRLEAARVLVRRAIEACVEA